MHQPGMHMNEKVSKLSIDGVLGCKCNNSNLLAQRALQACFRKISLMHAHEIPHSPLSRR